MIFNSTRCPLCQRELEENWDGLECPTQVRDITKTNYKRWTSHYKFRGTESQILLVNPYRVVVMGTWVSKEWKLAFNITKYYDGGYHWVAMVDPFDFYLEDQLLNKIKMLVVFS